MPDATPQAPSPLQALRSDYRQKKGELLDAMRAAGSATRGVRAKSG